MDIAAWLQELGLERYVDSFLDNDIDAGLLPTLTADDLKELGVTSLGHRKALLEAIAALREPAGAGAETATPAAPRAAELRQLTVLFCDLVGSTELSARLDPEDMGGLIRAYQDCSADVVKRWEGQIAKLMGDGVLAYFGWPRAHEDDAERAVRAGLELSEAVTRLAAPSGEALAARIGIATGLVMVGDLVGEGAAQEQTVVGETPNVAARLQALAKPGTVAISQATRRLVGGLFELEDLGPKRLKGFAEPLAVWRVAGESRAEGRFEARQTAGLTPLVGREEEIGLLLRHWRQAADGEGQVVLLSGEPGIGKSRLVRELRARLSEEPHIRLLCQCSPHHRTSPLRPMIEQLERAAGFQGDDPPETRLDKLEAVIGRGTDQLDEAMPLIAALLGLATADHYPPLHLTAQRQKQRTLEVLVDQLEGLARARPVLLTYEDVHWIDPTTQELLGLAIERIQRLPILLLITFRPEFTLPWAGLPHTSSLALSRLGRREGAAMVEQVVHEKALPVEVSTEIVAKTDGVPLFVEELTKTVLESGLLRDAGDRYELSGPLPPLAIPSTLHDSLLARLDRLAPVKEVAQIGAVIGREFSHALLAAVAPMAANQLRTALDRLVAAELVFRRGTAAQATYTFKHALVQDAAYQSLLKSKRQQLHARIARTLESRFPETAATEPEVLGHHYAEAGLAEPAIEHLRRAGENAARRAANREAIEHFRKALDLLSSLAGGLERDAVELKILTQLGPALMLVKGWATAEGESTYRRARELAGRLESSADLVPPLVGLWLFNLSSGRFDAAGEVTHELFEIAQKLNDPDLILQAHHAAWPIHGLRGAFATADEHIRQGLALYDYERHRQHALVYMGHDPAVCAHVVGAQAVWALGFPEQAHQHLVEALELARRLGHPPTLAFALWLLGGTQAMRRDAAAALATAEELLQLSEEQRLPQTRASALVIGGWALSESGQADEGLQQARAGLAEWESMGMRNFLQLFTCLVGESCARAGGYAAALDHLAQALAVGEQTGERWWEAKIHDMRGRILLRSGSRDTEPAADSFRTAIQVARTQRAKSWELRAATSLARLWADQGRRREAHDLLAPVYGWFIEGLDTPDLTDARALLDQLA